jgi:hypothetical protein
MNPIDLIQAYLDNELSESGGESLRSWLEEDPAHVDQLVMEALIDSQLRGVLGETKIRQDLLSLACDGDLASLPETAQVPAPHVAQSGSSRQPHSGAAKTRRLLPSVAVIVAVVASLAACILAVVGMMTRERVPRQPDAAQLAVQPAPQSHPAAPAQPDNGPVAELSRVVGIQWSGQTFQPGQRLTAGQSIALDAGVLELTFDAGARVVIQAPACLKIESPLSLLLEKGKLSAEITDVRARGFCVNTPRESIIDQGTEFGVEVTPQGSSRVHVFKGAVDIASSASRQAAESRRLLENSGARVEQGSGAMTLLQDTGESFIRRVEDAGRDRHVVAYWRFEDRPVGAIAPDTGRNVQQVCATVDSSFNGNDLYTYIPESRPTFSDRVPAAGVPQTGCLNRTCLDTYSAPSYKGYGRDVYTHSDFSHASPIDIQKITPREWTIEASVSPHPLPRFAGVERESFPQTFVGRDATYAPRELDDPPRLALQINARQRFAIRFADVQGRFHEAVAEKVPVQFDHWYHVAAASDGRWLRLYVNYGNGRGYQLCASTALPDDEYTSLGKGEDIAEWTIGRGHVGKAPGEWFHGLIDEVRISDVARKPDEMLFSRPAGKNDASSQTAAK